MFRNVLIVTCTLMGGFGALSIPSAVQSSDCNCSCQSSCSSPDLDLRQLLDEFLAGASINDADVHDRFWHDDLVYTSSSGERFGKRVIMQGLAEPDPEAGNLPRYSAADVLIRNFGQTAVVTFRLLAEQEESLVGEYFNTGVFRCTQDTWQAVTWQVTRVQAQ